MLWVENDALPIFSPDREALEARFDSVFEHGLLVKSNIKDANNASLFQPDHILWFSGDLKANVDRAFFNEEDFFYLFNGLVDDGASVQQSGF